MKRYILTFVFFLLSLNAFCGAQASLLRGNKAYDAKKYGEAFDEYQKAAAGGGALDAQKAHYNSGAALYRLQDFGGAAEAYASAAEQDGALKESALFNLGNAYYGEKKNDEAIATYKKALKINPSDKTALHNLQIVLKEKQKQQQNKQCDNPQQKQNQENNSGGGSSKDENKQRNQDKNKENGGQNNQNKDDKGNRQNKPDTKEEEQKQSGITQDQADAILRIALEKESGLNDKRQRGGGIQNAMGKTSRPDVEKDW